jgi:hypothetical protein
MQFLCGLLKAAYMSRECKGALAEIVMIIT